MKITVEIGSTSGSKDDRPCVVEMYCDSEGLEYLIKELSDLKEAGDHVHLMTPSWGMHDLSEDKQIAENDLAHHLKLTLV